MCHHPFHAPHTSRISAAVLPLVSERFREAALNRRKKCVNMKKCWDSEFCLNFLAFSLFGGFGASFSPPQWK
jgi:hypothetical protein